MTNTVTTMTNPTVIDGTTTLTLTFEHDNFNIGAKSQKKRLISFMIYIQPDLKFGSKCTGKQQYILTIHIVSYT